MFTDLFKTNFFLNIFAGLCLPSVIPLRWPKLYFSYMMLTDLLSLLNLVTIGVNLLTPDVPISKRCYSGFTTLASALSVIKLTTCYIQKNQFSDYFKLWEAVLRKNSDEELEEALLKSQKVINRLSIGLFVFMVGPMIPWGSLPLFIKALSFCFPALEDAYLFIAVPAKFPFDPLMSPAFEFVTIFQGVAAVAVNAKLMAYDCLIYSLISCQIVQFKRLRQRIQHIVIAISKKQNTTENSLMKSVITWEDEEVQLHKWVQDHIDLVHLCRFFSKLYSPVFLLQFFFSTLILCSNAFVIVSATITKFEIGFSFGYVTVTIIQLFVLCWLGGEMIHQSQILMQDGFWEEWYVCPQKFSSSLKIIFERAKVPVTISAFGMVSLSIETFKNITGTSYSYFMFLNQVKKKF